MQKNKIRTLALGIIEYQNRLLVSLGYDQIKKQKFYRLPGGGIDFGELSSEALVREFREELGAELSKVEYLGTLENIFEFNGDQGHEIAFIFKASFKDKKFYQQKSFKILDSQRAGEALWVPISKLKRSRLYPNGVKKYF